MSALETKLTGSPIVKSSQSALYTALCLTGWFVTTLLSTLGLYVVFFILIGSFSLEGTLLQLDNMASRYAEADELRRTQFHQILAIVFAIAFAVVAHSRRGDFFNAFRNEEKDRG